MNVVVLFFGPFRKLGDEISLELDDGATITDVRAALEKAGADPQLLACSRFAAEDRILNETAQVQAGMRLAILAPVSGG